MTSSGCGERGEREERERGGCGCVISRRANEEEGGETSEFLEGVNVLK